VLCASFVLDLNMAKKRAAAPKKGANSDIKETSSDLVSSLPVEVLKRLTFFLSASDMGNLALVNSRFNEAFDNNAIWQTLFLKIYRGKVKEESLGEDVKEAMNTVSWKTIFASLHQYESSGADSTIEAMRTFRQSRALQCFEQAKREAERGIIKCYFIRNTCRPLLSSVCTTAPSELAELVHLMAGTDFMVGKGALTAMTSVAGKGELHYFFGEDPRKLTFSWRPLSLEEGGDAAALDILAPPRNAAPAAAGSKSGSTAPAESVKGTTMDDVCEAKDLTAEGSNSAETGGTPNAGEAGNSKSQDVSMADDEPKVECIGSKEEAMDNTGDGPQAPAASAQPTVPKVPVSTKTKIHPRETIIAISNEGVPHVITLLHKALGFAHLSGPSFFRIFCAVRDAHMGHLSQLRTASILPTPMGPRGMGRGRGGQFVGRRLQQQQQQQQAAHMMMLQQQRMMAQQRMQQQRVRPHQPMPSALMQSPQFVMPSGLLGQGMQGQPPMAMGQTMPGQGAFYGVGQKRPMEQPHHGHPAKRYHF